MLASQPYIIHIYMVWWKWEESHDFRRHYQLIYIINPPYDVTIYFYHPYYPISHIYHGHIGGFKSPYLTLHCLAIYITISPHIISYGSLAFNRKRKKVSIIIIYNPCRTINWNHPSLLIILHFFTFLCPPCHTYKNTKKLKSSPLLFILTWSLEEYEGTFPKPSQFQSQCWS